MEVTKEFFRAQRLSLVAATKELLEMRDSPLGKTEGEVITEAIEHLSAAIGNIRDIENMIND